MRHNGVLQVADLFCGAGGTSTGCMQMAAAAGLTVELTAVNHWNLAVETHARNHPGANHLCADLDSLNPRKAVPGGRLDLLWASPECTHHSRARGGRAMREQSRATAWCVLRWAEALTIESILIENVSEFKEWGPLYPDDHADEALRGRPIPEEKGRYFRNFVRNLQCLGYTVGWQELICANYGDATTRRRFFLMAKKGKRRTLRWPLATHQPSIREGLALEDGLKTWVPAREIIDWRLKGTSIFGRKRPLKPNTLRRIFAGLKKFGGARFVMQGEHSTEGDARRCYDLERPLPTVTIKSGLGVVEPYLVILHNHQDAAGVESPVGTICAGANHYALLEPFLVKFYGGHTAASVEAPLGTVTANYEHYGLAEPFLVGAGGQTGAGRPQSVESPLGTVLAEDHRALVQPFLVEYHGGRDAHRRVRTVDDPIPTQDTSNRMALAEPFLVSYYQNGQALSVEGPLPTVTTEDRFGLVRPELFGGSEVRLDILFRMLAPHELAAAHSFPAGYAFAGNRDEIVRQIGNSVPVRTAAALCRSVLA